MSTWNPDELNQIAETDEMYIAAQRRDGTDRKPVIVWMVRLGDDVYTRSVNGPSITSPLARSTTLKLVPQQEN
jgi:hypothetical protein